MITSINQKQNAMNKEYSEQETALRIYGTSLERTSNDPHPSSPQMVPFHSQSGLAPQLVLTSKCGRKGTGSVADLSLKKA